MNRKVLVIGSTVADVVLNVDVLPKTAQDVHIMSQQVALGGCAYNVSDVIRHLNVEYTLFSPVGTGIYGDFVKNALKEQGIEPKLLPEEENGCCYCMVEPGGERTFLAYHGAEYRFKPEWFETIDPDEYDTVYICGLEIEEPAGEHILTFLEKMFEKNSDKTLYFAPGPRILKIPEERMDRLFRLRPILHLNEDEAGTYIGLKKTEENVQMLRNRTGNDVVVTMGSKGAMVCLEDTMHYASVEPVQVTDTIGAGDAHAGAVIALRHKGLSWEETLTAANKLASYVTTVSGARLTEKLWDEFHPIREYR